MEMCRDKVRVCIIGTGRAGMIHGRMFSRPPNARLVAVVDSNEKAAHRAAQELEVEKHYTDYRDACDDDDIDAVCIATPTYTHSEIAVACAKAGKHIFCEKPMAITLDECDRMMEAVRESHVKLQIGFMRRFDRNFQKAKQILDDGEIGDVVLVKSLTRGPGLPPKWYFSIETSNGLLAEVNSHDIDTLRWFTGSEFARVYAEAGNYRCPELKYEYPDFYDNIVLNARFEDGKMGVIDGACPDFYGYDSRTEVLGTRGVLFVGQVQDETVVCCTKDSGVTQPVVSSWRHLFRDAYMAEDEHFIHCILNDEDPAVTGLDGKKAVEVVLAGNCSIKEGKVINL